MEEDKFHNAISRELGGINERLNGFGTTLQRIDTHLEKLNSRTSKLEQFKATIKTKAGFAASVISVGTTIVTAYIINLMK